MSPNFSVMLQNLEVIFGDIMQLKCTRGSTTELNRPKLGRQLLKCTCSIVCVCMKNNSLESLQNYLVLSNCKFTLYHLKVLKHEKLSIGSPEFTSRLASKIDSHMSHQ